MGNKLLYCLKITNYGVVLDSDSESEVCSDEMDFTAYDSDFETHSKIKKVGLKLPANNEV